jgi:hypothetical protein
MPENDEERISAKCKYQIQYTLKAKKSPFCGILNAEVLIYNVKGGPVAQELVWTWGRIHEAV